MVVFTHVVSRRMRQWRRRHSVILCQPRWRVLKATIWIGIKSDVAIWPNVSAVEANGVQHNARHHFSTRMGKAALQPVAQEMALILQ